MCENPTWGEIALVSWVTLMALRVMDTDWGRKLQKEHITVVYSLKHEQSNMWCYLQYTLYWLKGHGLMHFHHKLFIVCSIFHPHFVTSTCWPTDQWSFSSVYTGLGLCGRRLSSIIQTSLFKYTFPSSSCGSRNIPRPDGIYNSSNKFWVYNGRHPKGHVLLAS